ncbi:DUF817 domain-containing protein [Henriciella sp.]|uniref:DUF817 domain-containing protein n=1 Tax=Henriciella sp. TaxID=1968823 RepID=UPI00345C4370
MKGPVTAGVFEFVSFGIKQAWACIFGGLLLALILATHLWYPETAWLSRYDFLVITAIFIQVGLIATGLETWEEARVILVFHVVGTVMEIFKTSAGSWIYPEDSLLRIGGVPLFSGFMYAAVGSYLARVWRIFDFRFDHFPSLWLQGLLALAIYLNFFTHHFTVDIRNVLFVATLLVYGRSIVWFRPDRAYRPMPLVLGFGLVALFIWIAENLGTLARAWTYPGQESVWKLVSAAKFGSWYLLMIISFVLVALVHSARKGRHAEKPADR